MIICRVCGFNVSGTECPVCKKKPYRGIVAIGKDGIIGTDVVDTDDLPRALRSVENCELIPCVSLDDAKECIRIVEKIRRLVSKEYASCDTSFLIKYARIWALEPEASETVAKLGSRLFELMRKEV